MTRSLKAVLVSLAGLVLPPGEATASTALRWPAPVLTAPTTVAVTDDRHVLRLNPAKDYVIELPSDRPLRATGGLVVDGGNDVVLVGGEISIPRQGPNPGEQDRRGLYLKNQTGTAHVEGLRITGPDLNEGINLDQRRGATVQLQNIRVENPHARDAADLVAAHPDVLQTWGGPALLRIHGMTATTSFQGFFLQPSGNASAPTKHWQISDVNLIGLPGSTYLLWKTSGWSIKTSRLWLQPAQDLPWTVRGSRTEWGGGVFAGTPPAGEFVPRGSVGLSYVSPASRATAPR